MSMIKVLVADDQLIVAEGLCSLLSLEQDIEVMGNVSNGCEVLDFLVTHHVDVILMDIRMPTMNGVECTRKVNKNYPKTNVLILTTFDDDEYIREAICNGAAGYMLKDLTGEELSVAIRNVYHGNNVMHHVVTKKIFSGITSKSNIPEIMTTDTGESLTPRELEVLKLVGRGYSNTEIAEDLFLSIGTVKNYVTILYDKFDIKGRTKLMRFAIKSNLLD
jgi:DNA-binding NarL/FixJ family response regulator